MCIVFAVNTLWRRGHSETKWMLRKERYSLVQVSWWGWRAHPVHYQSVFDCWNSSYLFSSPLSLPQDHTKSVCVPDDSLSLPLSLWLEFPTRSLLTTKHSQFESCPGASRKSPRWVWPYGCRGTRLDAREQKRDVAGSKRDGERFRKMLDSSHSRPAPFHLNPFRDWSPGAAAEHVS